MKTTEELSAEHRKADIAIDFDGVINSYLSGYVGNDILPDPPVNGSIKFLKEVLQNYRIAIMSTRAETPEGQQAIKDYLLKYGMTQEEVSKIKIVNYKIHAKLYIDDRGFQFNGIFPTLEYIANFLPWYKRNK